MKHTLSSHSLEPNPKILSSKKYFYWIDWLRFLSALMVLLSHVRGGTFVEYGALTSNQKTPIIALFYAVTRLGGEAVIVFFVLSGFLVGGKSLERIATRSFKPSNYTIDRCSRILVPLIPALLLTALVEFKIHQNFNLLHFVGNLFSLQGILVPSLSGNSPLWSLPYEVWCYGLMGVVGLVASRRKFSLLLTGCFALVLIFFSQLNTAYLLCWFIGTFAYILKPHKSLKLLLIGTVISLYGIFSIQLNVASVSISHSYLQLFTPSVDISRLLLAIGIALTIQQLILLQPKKHTIARLEQLGGKLAAFSYTLYLTHMPVKAAIEFYFKLERAGSINLDSISIFIVKILICLALALFLYWLFEKRTTLVRDRVTALIKSNNLIFKKP